MSFRSLSKFQLYKEAVLENISDTGPDGHGQKLPTTPASLLKFQVTRTTGRVRRYRLVLEIVGGADAGGRINSQPHNFKATSVRSGPFVMDQGCQVNVVMKAGDGSGLAGCWPPCHRNSQQRPRAGPGPGRAGRE
jgi:hypothetical protein